MIFFFNALVLFIIFPSKELVNSARAHIETTGHILLN